MKSKIGHPDNSNIAKLGQSGVWGQLKTSYDVCIDMALIEMYGSLPYKSYFK